MTDINPGCRDREKSVCTSDFPNICFSNPDQIGSNEKRLVGKYFKILSFDKKRKESITSKK